MATATKTQQEMEQETGRTLDGAGNEVSNQPKGGRPAATSDQPEDNGESLINPGESHQDAEKRLHMTLNKAGRPVGNQPKGGGKDGGGRSESKGGRPAATSDPIEDTGESLINPGESHQDAEKRLHMTLNKEGRPVGNQPKSERAAAPQTANTATGESLINPGESHQEAEKRLHMTLNKEGQPVGNQPKGETAKATPKAKASATQVSGSRKPKPRPAAADEANTAEHAAAHKFSDDFGNLFILEGEPGLYNYDRGVAPSFNEAGEDEVVAEIKGATAVFRRDRDTETKLREVMGI